MRMLFFLYSCFGIAGGGEVALLAGSEKDGLAEAVRV
jgi:hypothetical protein